MFLLFKRAPTVNRGVTKVAIRQAAGLFVALGLATLTGCGGGSTSPLASQSDQINVTISPATATVNPGGSLQFSALVSGTSQTGVTWSASVGSITPGGLLQVPPSPSVTSLAVTATSTVDSQKQASATVTVSAVNPVINSTPLPSATVDVAYNTALSSTGGQPPYQWKIVSGSLPLNIQLNTSSGMLSGTPTVAGQSSFVVGLTDSKGAAAQQSLGLLVSPGACGPPTYPCSRSDIQIIAPAVPPQLGSNPSYFGGHSGAGMVGIDPAYGNRILRVTDGNTTQPGMSFGMPSSAESNLTSFDETLFFVADEGNNPCLVQFDAAAFTTKFRGCYGNIGIANMQFGYTAADNDVFFNFSGASLQRFVINTSNWTIAADPTFNGKAGFWPDGPLCLDGQLAAEGTWYAHGNALSSDDSTFIMSLGPEQDEDAYIVVWNAAKGCRWMNVQTWEVSQGWNTGLANPVKIAWVSGTAPTLPGGVHNVNLDRSGTYGILVINNTSLTTKVFWTIDTNEVNDTCAQCTSHWACDYGTCFWSYGPSTQGLQMYELPISSSANMMALPGVPDMVTTPPAPPSDAVNDEHASHANASPGQKNIYLLSLQPNSGGSTIGGIWDDEIIGVNWDGSKRTIRFNKNWNSGYGGFAGSARCSISRQGNYALCGSDYEMYNLDKGFGNGLNQDTCDHNLSEGVSATNGCRNDILLFELK